ncbi:hydrogenase maturation nickel metallochaperone HypA [Bacillus sp. DNRA2]|uniref:hydrogenase maturation nickel metallochaperone HypA n=1 Tax=Bacillus sp. DNRA2 TaxID=2723053 RepID=UPI00145F113F|nr:hydrogenase maturation nickel metallochaperone HypA [Bacillus sp. DNRA2]NMD71681.1 hydrogenase maturation nickel metallochaperone HypA [Bacillus sp. DNRA2]
MHELAMVRSIYDVINEKIKEYGVKKVKEVKLIVGELTGVEDMTMKSCFEIYVQATPIEGASLVIERVPVKVRCRICGNEFETKIPFSQCGVCAKKSFQIIAGKEFYIESLDVE